MNIQPLDRRKAHVPTKRAALVVIYFLGTFSILGLIGIFAALMLGRAVPEGVTILVATAVGALGSMLSNTEPKPDTPADVKITNPPSDPVPTEAVKTEAGE